MRSWLFAFGPNQSREHANPWGLVPFRVGSRLTGRGWLGVEAGVAVLSGLAPPPLAEEGSIGYRAVSHRGVDADAVLGMRIGSCDRAPRAHRPGLSPVPLSCMWQAVQRALRHAAEPGPVSLRCHR